MIEEDSALSKDIPPGELEQDEPIEIPRGPDDNSAGDRKLFLGGLSWETKEPQLKDYFEKFGEIESINLKLDPLTGRSRCFAFLVFKESSSIDQVLEQRWDVLKEQTFKLKLYTIFVFVLICSNM